MAIVATILPACNKKANTQRVEIEVIESDSARYERLRLEEEERLAEIESKMEKVYVYTDTIPFGDLSIILDKVQDREIETNEQTRRLNVIQGRSDMRTASLTVTFINNGEETVELPYASFAKDRKRKDDGEGRRVSRSSSRRPDFDHFDSATRLMLDAKSKKIIKDLTLKPGGKVKVVYLSVLNKTPQWLLRFTNAQQAIDTTATMGRQIQERLNNSGMEISIITDDYDGANAYVDLNDIL